MTNSLPPFAPEWPRLGLVDDIRPALADAQAEKTDFSLITLIRTDQGSPRPPGAQMLATGDRLTGYVSGGCVEGDVYLHASSALAEGRSRRLIYGRGSPWPDIRLLCGSQIELLVEPCGWDDGALQKLTAHWRQRRPVIYATTGERRETTPTEELALARRLELSSDPFSARLFLPPQRRLVVIGADPVVLALGQMARAMQFDFHLVRPRGPSTSPDPDWRYWRAAPSEALAEIGIDPWTFVVIASHDQELDHEALLTALPSKAAYVGVLGASRRRADRVAALLAAGLSEPDVGRLRTPVGLSLGGKAPFEVALSILAEITRLTHQPEFKSFGLSL